MKEFLFKTFNVEASKKDKITKILNQFFYTNSNFTQYFFNKLPIMSVSKILNINISGYNSGKDTFDDLLYSILGFFNLDTSINISDDSSFIKNIKDIVIPKYKLYLEISINSIHQILENYLFSTYNMTKDIDILLQI